MLGEISESRAKFENFLKGENFLRNSHEMFRCFPIIYNGKGGSSRQSKKLVQCSHIYFIADNKLWIFINIPALSRSRNQTSLMEEDKHSKKRFSRLLSQIGEASVNGGWGCKLFSVTLWELTPQIEFEFSFEVWTRRRKKNVMVETIVVGTVHYRHISLWKAFSIYYGAGGSV